MTRQKKELIKKIEYIDNLILAEDELGCGMTPPNFYRSLFQEVERLAEELAHLRGFKDQQEELEYECRVHPPAYLPYI